MPTRLCIAKAAHLFLALAVPVGALLLVGCASSSSSPATYTVGGTVSGLAGSGLVLQDNGGNNFAVSANGSFTFTTALASGAAYSVTVSTQPSNPSQTCVPTLNSGTVASSNITTAVVTCTTNTYTVGGNVSGLAGSGLVLRDNGGNNLAVSANGSFTFTTALASGTAYSVTVLTQPSSPTQTCVPTLNSGTVTTSNITTAVVTCTTNTYTVGGNVSGLAGSGLVLQDNGGNNLAVSANGSFTFTTPLASGAAYSVTVLTQPSNLSQTCVPTLNSGNVTAGNITTAVVTCTTNTFTVGGNVSSLAGSGLVLQDNGGNNLAVSASGSFTFTTPLASGAAYSVTVFSQPSNPTQTCVPTLNSGNVTAGNITTAVVTCTTNTFTVGGTVSGLAGSGLVLQDNGGNNLAVSANGSFTFTTAIASGAAFNVTVLTEPSNLAQICTVPNGNGTVTTGAITSVTVTCISTTTSLALSDAGNNRVLIYNVPFSTGQIANVVLGQANFVTGTSGTTASTMNFPASVATDGSGNLYVAEDGNNCRVTQFKPPFSTGMNASLVFGQPDLNTSGCPTTITASTLGNINSFLDQVFGVSADSSGNLWVSDSGSNRVLEYVPPFSNGMAATLAIGQADLVSGNPNHDPSGTALPTSVTLYDPDFAGFDPSGNLWVPDFGNNRLLEFIPPFSTGMAASVVLGQTDFVSDLPNQNGTPGPGTLSSPSGFAFDSSGNLWIADSSNNRVLEFAPPFTTNMPATLVLGQADFMSSFANQGGANAAVNTLSYPEQVAFDGLGNLFVTDSGNNRTLVFATPFSNNMDASLVLGQASSTSSAPATTAGGQNIPSGVVILPPPN